MNSNFLTLNAADFGKGILVSIGTAFFMVLTPVLQSGGMPTMDQLKMAGLAALAAGFTYIGKNLFTNSNGQIAKKEPEKQA